MACLRCGRKTREEQSFCDFCQEIAKAYPVNSNAPVQLPDRSKLAKPLRRRSLSPEETVLQLKRTVRSLTLAVIALSLVLGITAGLLLHSLSTPGSPETRNLGRNYTAVGEFD